VYYLRPDRGSEGVYKYIYTYTVLCTGMRFV
jgi:hypothetical protein